jgi:chromate transport protein ChrA
MASFISRKNDLASAIGQTLVNEWPSLAQSAWITLTITVEAFLWALGLGFLFAVAFAQSRTVERALLPVGIGLMTAGVYTLARSGIRDVSGAAIAVVAGLVLWTGRVPAMLVVLAAGAVGWLAAL